MKCVKNKNLQKFEPPPKLKSSKSNVSSIPKIKPIQDFFKSSEHVIPTCSSVPPLLFPIPKSFTKYSGTNIKNGFYKYPPLPTSRHVPNLEIRGISLRKTKIIPHPFKMMSQLIPKTMPQPPPLPKNISKIYRYKKNEKFKKIKKISDNYVIVKNQK